MVAGDSEFRLWAGRLRVTVDGIDLTSLCCGYDLDQQTVLIHVRGRDGRILLSGDKTLKTTVAGDVQVCRK